jgi:hypothetical protein
MSHAACLACDFPLDTDDNFCRRCGVSVEHANLPAVRGATSVTLWQPNVSPVVKGAAVMAAGTIGQFLVRRMVSGFIGGSRPARRRSILPIRRNDDGMTDEAQIITETVMMRRVRVRRPA